VRVNFYLNQLCVCNNVIMNEQEFEKIVTQAHGFDLSCDVPLAEEAAVIIKPEGVSSLPSASTLFCVYVACCYHFTTDSLFQAEL
jgi:hypothetical protein